MRVRVYVRVSTADQRCELQVRELREYAERRRWQIAEIYEDVSSGAKTSRPALNRLIADAEARNLIASWYGSWTGRKCFNSDNKDVHIAKIAKSLGLGLGTVVRTLQSCPKSS